MKSNNLFRDQVSTVTAWFTCWSECEKTVALYSLLKQLPPLHCRFLVQMLDQRISDQDIQEQEEEANNPAYICNLSQLPKEKVIRQLLNHLPLLHSGNTQAKNEYLSLIPSVLSHSLEQGVYIEESRQLLSYSLIHPAISSEERSQFNKWLEHLEKRFSNYHSPSQSQGQNHHHGDNGVLPTQITVNNSKSPVSSGWSLANGYNNSNSMCHSSESLNLNGRDNQGWGQGQVFVQSQSQGHPIQSRGHHPLQATISAPANFNNIVPPPPNSSANNQHQHHHHPQQQQQQQHQQQQQQPTHHAPLRRMPSFAQPISLPISNKTVTDWLDTNDAHLVQMPGRPASVMSDHAPLSPQSSSASSGSGSDSHTGGDPCSIRNTFMEEGSGMRDVPLWLKSLRLHKYAYLFQQLGYDEMLNITEEWLEKQNVTKGATNKILISVKKLEERQQNLRDLEKDITEGGSIKSCIWEMKAMLNTPLKANSRSGCDAQSPSPAGDAASNTLQEGDIPGQFMRLMTKVCTQLMLTSPYDDEGLNMYLQLIEKCINHEAFSQKQKKLLDSFKQQARQIRQPAPVKYYFDKRTRPNGNFTFPMNYSNNGMGRPIQRSNQTQAMNHWPKQNPGGMQWSFGAKRAMIGGSSNPPHLPVHRNNSHNTALFSRPSLVEQPVKQPVTRTQSAPMRSHVLQWNQPLNEPLASDNEINARLDSLCRSVTECALGGMDGNERGSAF